MEMTKDELANVDAETYEKMMSYAAPVLPRIRDLIVHQCIENSMGFITADLWLLDQLRRVELRIAANERNVGLSGATVGILEEEACDVITKDAL